MTTTIILTVSRSDFLNEVLSSIELLHCDETRTNLLCIVDGDNKLLLKVRNLIQETKFNERLTLQYPNKAPIRNYDIMFRRKRIADIHRFARDNLGVCDNIFLAEDDTILPKDALEKLLKIRFDNMSFGMAEGVELGRWGVGYVGAWSFNDIYTPTEVSSLERKESGIDNIDAGGFYCALIRADLYKSHDFALYESLGADISFGLKLRQSGYENFIDWSINCTHLYKENGIQKSLIPSRDAQTVTLRKQNNNNWVIKY